MTEKSNLNETAVIPVVEQSVETIRSYGKYIRRSTVCNICIHPRHMEINLLRARDRLEYDEIALRMNVHVSALDKHFKNHFQISRSNRMLLELEDEGGSPANELVEKILERDLDLFSAAEAVLQSKAKRLNVVFSRLDELADSLDENGLSEFETGEFIQIHKLATEIENDILKTHQMIDKKLFPYKEKEMVNAVLTYKLGILSKMLDQIQLTLIEFQRKEGYESLVKEIRGVLAGRINQLEDEILKSGGILRPSQEEDKNED